MLHLATICCLNLTSQADSVPTASIPHTFPNFVISFSLHHSSFPTVIPLFLFFQFILNSVGDATPPHFFVFLPPLPRWQLSLRTGKILHLWQLCFFLVLQPLFGSHRRTCHSEMSHRKSKLSYSPSCSLPPLFFLFSDLVSVSKQMLLSPFCAAVSSRLKQMLKKRCCSLWLLFSFIIVVFL